MPCARRRSLAFSMSPPEALSASLQSIAPAPVFLRSSITSFASISMALLRRGGSRALVLVPVAALRGRVALRAPHDDALARTAAALLAGHPGDGVGGALVHV